MERREYYLLASRAACTVLAVASFAIGPPLSRNTLVAEAFVAIMVSAFWAMLMCPLLMLLHVGELRQWQCLQAAPGDHFAYPVVFLEWAMATVYWASASAAFAILINPAFRGSCRGDYQRVCRRYDVACGLIFGVGALTVAHAVVLHRARNRSNRPRLLVLLFGH